MKPAPPPDLWAQMDALVSGHTPPEGSFTIYEMMERYKMNREKARHFVDRLVSQGRAERCGSFNGRAHYILK